MQTPLDQIANQNHLHLIKAFLPYVASGNQRTLSILIKMMEIQNVISFYQKNTSVVTACSASSESPDLLDILNDIRNYCEEKEQALLDQWIQILSVMELSSIFSQSSDNGMADFPLNLFNGNFDRNFNETVGDYDLPPQDTHNLPDNP